MKFLAASLAVAGFAAFSFGYWRGIRARSQRDRLVYMAFILFGIAGAVGGGIWFFAWGS